MPMENDNSHGANVVVTAEQSTKINETDVRLPENRQSGVVSDAGSGSEKGEEGVETSVAVAVEDSGSNLVGELPPRSSSARVPFTNLSQIDADLALARTLQEQVGWVFLSFPSVCLGFLCVLGYFDAVRVFFVAYSHGYAE